MGRDDYDAAARAQGQLVGSKRLSVRERIAAYRVVRVVTPGAYTEKLVADLISLGYQAGEGSKAGMAAWTEAVEVAREAVRADPRDATLLVDALGPYRRGLADAGRRAEALEACREMALAGRTAHEAGVTQSPLRGSWDLVCMLAEEGKHAKAAALFEAMVRDHERADGAGKDFWTKIAWIAEAEASGDHAAARSALRELIDQDRARAEQETGPYAVAIWELLLLAAMDRGHGREQEAESCDETAEELLTLLASGGEPKNWSNILSWWIVLAGLTGRTQDRPALSRALADRAGMHVAARDCPPALRDFTEARRLR